MDIIFSSNFNKPWWAAHQYLSENEFEDVDVPNLCEEVRWRLAGARGGRGGSGMLTLGSAAALLHGAALLLLHKAKHTLQDTFELTQKITLKNDKVDSDYTYTEDEQTEESEEDGDLEAERSSTSSGKRSAGSRSGIGMSKRMRTITGSEISDTESDSIDDITHSEGSGNDSDGDDHEDNRSQTAISKVEDEEERRRQVEIKDCAVQTCRCVREASAGTHGFDPRLKLGVMLLYDDHSQLIPSKVLISSINPTANFN